MDQSAKKNNDTTDLNDIILSNPQLKELGANSRLFEIKYQSEVKGIAVDKDLKDFFSGIQDNLSEFKFYSVREVYISTEGELEANQEFIHVQKHPYFQRRRPQVHGALSANDDTQIWLVDHGHKNGPFTLPELQEKIDQKQLKLSDLVSVDEGHTWGKIYQLKGFDRRDLSAQKLPQGPSIMALNEAENSAEKQLRYSKNKKGEWDALAGLSYLGQGRHLQNKSIWDEKLHEKNEIDEIEIKIVGDHTPKEQKSGLLKIILLLAIFVGLLGTLIQYVSTPETINNEAATAVSPRAMTKKNTAIETPATNFKQNPGRQAPAIGERKYAPNAKSKKNDQNYGSVPEENFYYDDGSTPYEQDPARKKLGREHMNPNISPFDGRPKRSRDDSAEGLFGNGRAPASGSEDGLFEQEAEL